MAAPSDPVPCVMLLANGSIKEVVADQRKYGEMLGGRPTVVGAIISLGVEAIARNGAKGKKNQHALPESFEANIKGDVILFRTDEDASPIPFTAKEYREWVDAGMPDDGPEEAEDEEEEEEDEEEEETLEEFTAKMKDLTMPQVREACKVLGVSDKGSRQELMQRLHEKAAEGEEDDDDSDDDDDDDEDDDDEEEEEEEEAIDPAEQTRTFLSSLPLAKLRETAQKLDVSSEGSKANLVDRLVNRMVAGGEEDEDDDDDDEEEEEEEEVPIVESKAKGKAKASPAAESQGTGKGKAKASPAATMKQPSAVKTIAKGRQRTK